MTYAPIYSASTYKSLHPKSFKHQNVRGVTSPGHCLRTYLASPGRHEVSANDSSETGNIDYRTGPGPEDCKDMNKKDLLQYIVDLEKKTVRSSVSMGEPGPCDSVDDYSRCMAYSISAPAREIKNTAGRMEKELREIYQAPASAWSGRSSGKLPRLDLLVDLLADMTYHTSLVGEMLDSISCGKWVIGPGTNSSDINAVIEHWTSRIKRARHVGSNVSISYTLDRDLPRIGMRESEIFQVIYQIVANALESLPFGEGGQVKIKTFKHGGEVVFEVMDNGYGIRQDARERIFNPFYTTKGYREPGEMHPGLGLYIVRCIVESHDGRIEVRSEQGIGSVISVFIPVTGA